MNNGAWTGLDFDRFNAVREFDNQRLINERNGIVNSNMISRSDFVYLLNEFTNEAEEAKIRKKMEKKLKMRMKMKAPENENLKNKMIIPKSRGYGMLTCPVKEIDEIETDSEIEERRKELQLYCKEVEEKFKRERPEEYRRLEEWRERKERKKRMKKMMKKKNKKKVELDNEQ